MAKEERIEIQWAMFVSDVRLASSQAGVTKAISKNGGTSLFFGYIAGLPFLIVEDEQLPFPATIPWSNISSVGWVRPPTISDSAPKKVDVLK